MWAFHFLALGLFLSTNSKPHFSKGLSTSVQ